MIQKIISSIFQNKTTFNNLHRWCHPNMIGVKCSQEIQKIKSDLANYDNSFGLDKKKKVNQDKEIYTPQEYINYMSN